MGKCISKHPSALTIALSEKDLATANQIWSKFAESTEYIALKDEYGNQLCEYYYVSNSKNGGDSNRHGNVVHGKQEQQQQQQHHLHHHHHQQQQQQQHHDEDEEKAMLPPRNENKSGQWTSEKIKYDDDTAVVVAKHIVGCGTNADATSTTTAHVGSSHNSITSTSSIVNNSSHHKDAIEVEDEEAAAAAEVHSLLAHLRLQHKQQERHQDIVDHFAFFTAAPSDSNNNANENISGVKNNKNNKNKQKKTSKKMSAKLINYYSNEEGEVTVVDAQQTKWPKFSSADQINVDNSDCTPSSRSHELSFLHLCGNFEGQTESKKSAKKHAAGNAGGGGLGIETKGTAMSFGFRKKLNTTPKKLKKLIEGSGGGDRKKKQQQDKYNNIKNDNIDIEGEGERFTEIGTVIDTDEGDGVHGKDNNGNAELMPKIHFEKMGAVGKTLCAAVAAQQKTLLLSNQGVSSPTATTEQPQNHRPSGVGNRFGYRGGSNIVRPASTGITPTRYQNNDAHENAENNNGNVGGGGGIGGNGKGSGDSAIGGLQQKVLVSNLKRRSKSAHAGRALTSNQSGDVDDETKAAATPKITQPKTITFNLNQNSTIEYQRRQFFQQPQTSNVSGRAWPQQQHNQQQLQYQQQQLQQQHKNIVNSGMHTNLIVRPTPRAAALQPTTTATATTYSKFTLHTVSLPKPEFPVAISLNATTPTTPVGGIISSSPITTVVGAVTVSEGGARAKDQQPHPLTAAQSTPQQQQQQFTTIHMDLKTAKQMANNTRRGFSGSREISADSGIASMDMALDSSTSSGGGGSHGNGRHSSPKRSRSRPRNLQMVMSGRHKFEVRDLDTEPLSSESSSVVEPLALPKLPSESQTIPLPLSGLVRSNTVLSRESYERKNAAAAVVDQKRVEIDKSKTEMPTGGLATLVRNPSEESESIDEEKLYLDRSTSEKSAKQHHFRDINTCSSKTSSPGSSIMLSWCNAGESLAVKDCSSLSISSSEDSNKVQGQLTADDDNKKPQLDSNDDDLSIINTDMQCSTISSITEALIPIGPNSNNAHDHSNLNEQKLKIKDLAEKGNQSTRAPDRPKSLYNTLNESKFAEMALEGSTYLLDDETSPTDSLVSSTDSEDAAAAGCKQKKHKLNEELQEKDIDEISPELEIGSPISPGTPTHASHSLSLSDCGNLIDDEIADQPALLFNNDIQDGGDIGDGGCGFDSLASHKEKTDTPTLMETAGGSSMRSLKSQSKARTALQQAIELSLRTPLSLRKAVMERAESLDTLSPCESICSDDLMMDFDINSSIDSIDRSTSIKSRSGSDLNKIDETELFSELERKGGGVMKELNTILRIHTNRNTDKDSVIAHLPARATRLLNRSRLQQQCPLVDKTITAADSDSSKSTHSLRRSAAASRASTATSTHTASTASPHNRQRPSSHHHHHQQQHLAHSQHGSSDDLMLYDKSFRNAMIQDVLQFKKQLLRLRRILQEDEDYLMRTETLNPFENDNGQLFASCGLDSKLLDDIDLASLTSSITDDPMQELADLRRQVVYLQGQVDDRDRTIRLQRNLIEKLEAEKCATSATTTTSSMAKCDAAKECINIATQTERTRPLSIGPEGLSRSKPEYTSYTTTHYPTICSSSDTSTTIIKHQQYPPNNPAATTNQTRRHTIISTTLTNYNHQLQLAPQRRRASIAWEKEIPGSETEAIKPTPTAIYKPVKITLIGEPLPQSQWLQNGNKNGNVDIKKKNLVNGNGIGNGIGSGSGNGVNDLVNGSKQSGLKNVVNGVKNGHHHHDVKDNDKDANVYLRLENMTTAHNHHHHHHHQYYNNTHQTPLQKDNKIYKLPTNTHTNGNLNPTVTIV